MPMSDKLLQTLIFNFYDVEKVNAIRDQHHQGRAATYSRSKSDETQDLINGTIYRSPPEEFAMALGSFAHYLLLMFFS